MNMKNSNLTVAVFCGGRGCRTIARELNRNDRLDLHLFINAYDDGLSSGRLRQFIPGMLGPSNFRKNIVNLLDRPSYDRALGELLEYRLPNDFGSAQLHERHSCIMKPGNSIGAPNHFTYKGSNLQQVQFKRVKVIVPDRGSESAMKIFVPKPDSGY